MSSDSLLQRIYLSAVSLIGLLILIWSLQTLPATVDWSLLLLLLALNAAAQTVAAVSVRGNMTFGVGSAVNLAAVALFGLQAGVLVALVANLSLWLALTASREGNWQGKLIQLPFNLGMEATYVAASGWLLLWLLPQAPHPFLAWVAAALFNDQLNMWLLYVMLRLQHGVPARRFFAGNRQAIPINVTILAVGGFLLSRATLVLGWQGILLFLFPLLLAAYSFRLYVRESDRQLAVINDRNQQLADANDQLQQLAQHKERMLAVLSHDMRTSLSAIRASSHLLLEARHLLAPEKQLEMLQMIVKSEQMLTGMVSNILKVEQHNQQVELDADLSVFDLAELTSETTNVLRPLADEKQIRLRLDLPSQPLLLTGDRQMVQQVVLNLVSNAIKYSDSGANVSVSLDQQRSQARLQVEDTGLGIASADLPRIFEPYFRASAHETVAAGTGLGLAIVRRFVDAHRGKIDVSSRPGQGTRFSVWLPLRPPRDIDVMLETASDQTHLLA